MLQDGRSIGVLLFYLETGSFADQIVGRIERTVENVAVALRGFKHERRRRRAERLTRRPSDVFKALGATNTAILRARNAEEMFQQVCADLDTKAYRRNVRKSAAWRARGNTGRHDYRFDFFPAFLLFFAVLFDARVLVAPFFFFFATAVAISRLVIGTLSDESGESTRVDFLATDFFAMISLLIADDKNALAKRQAGRLDVNA